jgi:rhodanese-related sulfurtransferase
MSVKNISPEQTRDILEGDIHSVYIDVRTEQEFLNGHVPGSINIPVAWPNPPTGQMTLNPDFVKVVSTHFAKDVRIIIGCQSGGRSKFAAEILAKEGFQNVSNMQGGFGGVRDSLGRLIEAGWTQLGLQVEMDVHPDRSYASLKTESK